MTYPRLNTLTTGTNATEHLELHNELLRYTHMFYDDGNESGSWTVPSSNGLWVKATLTGNIVVTPPTGLTTGFIIEFTVQLIQDGTGGRTITWNNVTWYGDSPTTVTTAGSVAALVRLITLNGGTNWLGYDLGGGSPGGSNLGELADVDTTGAVAGESLVFDGSVWSPNTSGNVQRVQELIDVDLTGLVTGDNLSWDGAQWVPGGGTAADVVYAPASTGLVAINLQTAIDELAGILTAKATYDTVQGRWEHRNGNEVPLSINRSYSVDFIRASGDPDPTATANLVGSTDSVLEV